MKLAIIIFIATVAYGLSLRYFIREYKTQTSAEERKANQTGPVIFASTVFYLTIVVKTTQLAMAGVLPLL